jgi:hypothetical protein
MCRCNTCVLHAWSFHNAQVRDFIHESLYHPVTGYFSRHASPVGRVDPPIDFGALPGREGYQRKLHELYHQQKVAHSFCVPSCWRSTLAPLRYEPHLMQVRTLDAASKCSMEQS